MNDSGASRKATSETFTLDGQTVEKVLDKVKELIHEGNVRQVTVKGGKGETIAVFPLSAGVVGVALLPIAAAIAALAAIVTDCTITVERREG